MSFQQTTPFRGAPIDAERALNIGVGLAAAPLWGAFLASAGFGAAWWWTTAWTRSERVTRVTPAMLRLAQLNSVEETVGQSVRAVEEVLETGAELQAEVACEIVDAVERANSDEPAEIFPATASLAEAVEHAVELAQETLAESGDATEDSIEIAVETVQAPISFQPPADAVSAGAIAAATDGVVAPEEVAKPKAPRRKR